MSSRLFMDIPILSRLFAKRGIKDVNDLDPEERETYKRYEIVLSKRELTIADIRVFLQNQVNVIESKWSDFETPNAKKAELIPYHTVYRTILQALDAPEIERQNLERYLVEVLK